MASSLRGAVEEMLLNHRAMIEEALYPLHEHAQLDEILQVFQRCILELQQHEPAFWELRVVEYIHHVIKAQVGVLMLKREKLSDENKLCQNANDDDVNVAPPTPVSSADYEPFESLAVRSQAILKVKGEVTQCAEFASASEQIYCAVQDELLRLSSLLDDVAETASAENQRVSVKRYPEFLQLFWEQLERTVRERDEHSRYNQHGGDTIDDTVSCSFEAISFDDLNDECGSANSGPSFEDIPSITIRLQHPDPNERKHALDDLLEIPHLEIVHCGSNFRSLCTAITGLFLQVDAFRSDLKAKKLVYELLNHVEHALTFLDVYWSVLEFTGKHFESGQLYFEKKNAMTTTDQAVISVIDVYRLLLVLLSRITHHWIHYSTETLAKVLFSTFQLLILSPACAESIETRLIRPFKVLSLLDSTANWFKTWLHKTPACAQLFVALQESGLVAELLQYLFRVRPLEKLKSLNSVADEVERRVTQHLLCIVSSLAEFQDGRRLLCSSKRIPAHLLLKYRQVHWTMPSEIEMECESEENDRVYHLAARISVEDVGESEDGYDETERLGEEVVNATIMSIVTIVLTDPSTASRDKSTATAGPVAECLISSISRYLSCLDAFEAIADAILNLVERCFQLPQGSTSQLVAKRVERESEDPWFPFRRVIDLKDAENLITDAIGVRSQSGELDLQQVQQDCQLLLTMILQLQSRTCREDIRSSKKLQAKVLQLSRHMLQDMALRFSSEECNGAVETAERSFLSQLGRLLSNSEAYQLAKSLQLVQKLAALHELASSRNMRDLCSVVLGVFATISVHSAAMEDINDSCMSEICARHLVKQWCSGTRREEVQQQALRFLVIPRFSALFFTSDTVQCVIGDVVSKLLSSSVFTLAINSSPDEYPSEVGRQMNDLMFLRCCLSTQHASTVLLATGREENSTLTFIVRTLLDHGENCLSTCDAEDLCTVAFGLILALVSSVPAALQCASVFAKNKLILLLTTENQERRHDDQIISSCTLLGSQLQETFEVIGGSSEKQQRCALYDFDGQSAHRKGTIKFESPKYSASDEVVTPFVETLLQNMVSSIQDSCNRSTPLDFVMLSQATWELIHELEDSEGHSTMSLVPAQFTKVFGKLMYHLVMTKRCRLDEAPGRATRVPILPANSEKELPADPQKKLLNQLYKGYCRQLGLKASPTTLHCIIKKFGRHALDSFPVTVLMILDQLFSEKEISAFLTCCWSSPGGIFLWSSGVSSDQSSCASEDMPTLFRVASAVELVLEREYPQLLQCIEQCQCSVLTLALRWLGQCFWNYFDWNNIVLYVYLTVLHGPEFQVYIVVAVVKHLEAPLRLLSSTYSTQSMASFLDLTGRPISGFCFGQWRNLFLRLRNEYHEDVRRVLYSTAEAKLEELKPHDG